MQKAFRTLLALTALASLAGCTYFQFPGVHKIEIQQGNIITQEMVDQLKPGMTKRQVRFVLGTPLVADTFNQNRWDYFYSKRDPKGKVTQERITVLFENDTLSHIAGDFVPNPTVNAD